MCQIGQQTTIPGGRGCGTVGRLLVLQRHKFPVLAVLAGFLLVLGAPAPVPAQSPGGGQLRLRQREASLAAESRAAVVELYGLESRLAQARSDLARIQVRARTLARTQASIQHRLQAARQTMAAAQQHLGDQLRYLYEQGVPDPIAVVLGATSLENAIDALDAIHRARRATQSVLDQARSARADLLIVRQQLAVQVSRTNEARARLADTAAGLERAYAERTTYLARLRHEQELTAVQISDLERQAEEARARTQQITGEASAGSTAQVSAAVSEPTPAPAAPSTSADASVPPPAPVESVEGGTPAAPAAAPPPPRPGGTLTVYATGYCLKGTTATGLPVGPGIVATDPSVIPLGTRMTIPGYGEGVAADTGGNIQGRRIDVWIKSCTAAAAFGRTVTITFH
jgi:3D (Asp-Asp-Asp) domain-containing protein/peptidoglycan hydrolase CwlO-like protein